MSDQNPAGQQAPAALQQIISNLAVASDPMLPGQVVLDLERLEKQQCRQALLDLTVTPDPKVADLVAPYREVPDPIVQDQGPKQVTANQWQPISSALGLLVRSVQQQ